MTRQAAQTAAGSDLSGQVTQGSFDLEGVIDRIAHWLPTQSPIKDFIHHNTLHALQDKPFHEAVAIASRMFGANSYLPIQYYQDRYQKGRITPPALSWALERVASDPREHDSLRQALFEVDHSAHYPPSSLAHHGIRQKWLTHIEVNLDAFSQPVLFRFAANFLDQGISRWSVARPDESLWNCLWRLADNSFIPLYPFDEPIARGLTSLTPEAAIEVCLARIVGSETLYEQYLLEMLLMHPGWSGMVRVIEISPRSLITQRRVSLKEWIAVELALELAFLHKRRGETFLPVEKVPGIDRVESIANILAQPLTSSPLRVWHDAMEYSMHAELLQALAGSEPVPPAADAGAPEVQALFCIDDRECSLRRHLEEIHPVVDTYGAAGFFGVDFYFKGVNDAYAVAQCPSVISPRHLVVEKSCNAKVKPAAIKPAFLPKQNSLMHGWLHTSVAGLGYGVRMAWDVFKPGSRLLGIKQLGEVDAHTNLHLLRESDEPTEDGRILGFSHSEMADRIEGLLKNIGLTKGFAKWVVVVAHGSSSVNNPHFAAYDCGACSGRPGAPNARAFASMANDMKVRAILWERGIEIPVSTRFLAAMHNTTRDEIRYYDEYQYGDHAPEVLRAFKVAMEEALARNDHERCRWFELGPRNSRMDLAHPHVRARSASIFETRPELKHSSNLYCIVGRRTLPEEETVMNALLLSCQFILKTAVDG